MIQLIVGTQWGDEGKGKFIDNFAEKSDFVVRYNGSGGAAHTVVNKYGLFRLHLLPCGVFDPKITVLITNGVMVEPELLLKEIAEVEKAGVKLKGRLFISPRCNLVFPYHKTIDGATNAMFAGKSKKSPTTGRGNGPVHADKVMYQGIRIYDVMDKERFKKRLAVAIEIKNKFSESLGGLTVDYQKTLDLYLSYIRKLKSYIYETLPILENAVKNNKRILVEGVNGFFLDNDWGAYPYVTAASVMPSDFIRGSGINPYLTKHETVGIVKAYMTRVDNGECPLPTEWPEGKGTKDFRDRNNEYGAGTGRPRRISWFDAEVVKTSHRLCHFDYLCLTRLDSLAGLKKIKIGIGYTYRGKKVDYLDGDAEFYRKVRPIYEEINGWNEDLNKIRKYSDLPKNVRRYVERIEKLVGVPIKYLGVGAEREAIIKRSR